MREREKLLCKTLQEKYFLIVVSVFASYAILLCPSSQIMSVVFLNFLSCCYCHTAAEFSIVALEREAEKQRRRMRKSCVDNNLMRKCVMKEVRSDLCNYVN